MFQHRFVFWGCIAAMLLTAIAPSAIAQDTGLPWIGTWAVSPVPDSSGRSFDRQTLRQIVHTSVAGSSARIHISNAFGTQPLAIGNVHIALRSTGSSITAGTDHPVTFAGVASVTVQPGAVAVSDPVAFAVPRLADIAVSIYLPVLTGPATYHQAGLQTNYIAAGDVSGNSDLTDAKTTQSYYFLTNVDVQGHGLIGAVATMGASITDGFISRADENRRWPNDLAQRLADAGLVVGVLNQGISGNRLLVDGAGPSGESRFERDVLEQPGIRWVIFADAPINDLGSTKPPPTADQLIAGIRRLIADAHRKQIRFFCSTLTPYQGANYWTPAGETAREQLNAFIRGQDSGCDAVIDQDTATHDPAHPAQYLPAYDSGDHLHPNPAGLQAIANAVNLALFSAPPANR